jgi:hypothetical protein
MTESTPLHALPLLAAGQAQKEITHNEALVLIDALIAARVEAANVVTPPASPTAGQCWAIGAAPTGPWAGQAGTLGIATAGGWRFCPVTEGFAVRIAASGALWHKQGSGWDAPAAVAAPAGGAIIDSEARAAILAMRTMLIDHGLIASP